MIDRGAAYPSEAAGFSRRHREYPHGRGCNRARLPHLLEPRSYSTERGRNCGAGPAEKRLLNFKHLSAERFRATICILVLPARRSACAGKVANSPGCAGVFMFGSGIFSKLARTRLNEDEGASADLLEIDYNVFISFVQLEGSTA